MRAVVTRTQGTVEVVETATPAIGPDQVLVRVAAATLNPVDLAIVGHGFGEGLEHLASTGLGWDLAGTVEQVGEQAAVRRPELSPGTRVAAVHHGFDKPLGALAEHAAVHADAVALVPDGLDDAQAASLPLNVLTAAQAVDLLDGVGAGTLLVTGAAGAVGGWALTFARERGWQVLGHAREGDREFVEGQGARLVTTLEGLQVDAVLDAATLPGVVDALRDGGTYVGVLPAFPLVTDRDVAVTAVGVEADGERLTGLLRRAAGGELPVRVAATFPLDEVEKAAGTLGRGGVRGRVVVTV